MSDMERLARAGITAADAETALRLLYAKLAGRSIADFEGAIPSDLMRIFGPDAGRAAVVLTR